MFGNIKKVNAQPNPFSAPEPWELVATGYEATTMAYLGKYTERAIHHLQIQDGATVLDVACGPGTVTRQLANRASFITALDFSPNMIALLDRYLVKNKIKSVRTMVGNGQNIPLKDSQFDHAISMFGLMFFPDRIKGFSELFRLLKPGGSAAVSSWAPVDQSPAMRLMFGALRAANPDMPAPQRNAETLENPDVFKREMEKGGFIDVSVHRVTCDMEAESLDELWSGFVRGSAPIVLLRKKVGEKKWLEMEKKALAYISENVAAFPVKLGSDAWIGVGRKVEKNIT